MSKTAKKSDAAAGQLSLFDLLRQESDEWAAAAPARLNVAARLNAAIALAIRHAPKSRETIADEMTHLLGVPVTVHMLNAWTAESKELHRFPAEFLPAFCVVTGCNDPLRILAEAAGVFTLPGPDALRAEIQKLDEEVHQLQSAKRKRLMFLQELEGRK